MMSPLISAEELSRMLGRHDIRVVDCRWYLGEPEAGRAAYDEGHVPGAVFASLDTHLSGVEGAGRHPLPTPAEFSQTLATLGISNTSTVVVYDDRGGAIASRLWWMLTDQGLESVRVLDGGIQAWAACGGVLETIELPVESGSFTTRPWRRVVDQSAVADRADHVLVIDARSTERFRGEEEPVDPKAGHIPGARSMPQTNNLRDDLTFLSPSELRVVFGDAGTVDGDTSIAQCGSGVTACHNILAMELAGMGRPHLYVGSWSDWSSSDLPVAIGDEE